MTIMHEVREEFVRQWARWKKDGEPERMLQIRGVSFLANEPTLFGQLNQDYINREIAWYESSSLYVEDIPGQTPAIWKMVAGKDGDINSNYGHLIYNERWLEFEGELAFSQFDHAVRQLRNKKSTRQAVMIYTRPSIHEEWNENGKHDFICTNVVHYQITDNDELSVVVQMRSNDAVFGYRNDYAWQVHVADKVKMALFDTYPKLKLGSITWQVANLHVYPRHFHLVEHYARTGEYIIPLR